MPPIVYSESNRIYRESELSHSIDAQDIPLSKSIKAHSTENQESPFKHHEPKLKMTGIFVDRFFKGLPYDDISVKYDVSVSMARSHYHKAVKKLERILEAMDSPEMKSMNFAREKVHGVGEIPKAQKYFLLNRLFGLIPTEIAEMEGVKSAESVRKLIIRVSDKYATGEISLMQFEPNETAEAGKRLDTERAYHRNYARKKIHAE